MQIPSGILKFLGRAGIAAVVLVYLVWGVPAEWRHRQWKKQFKAEWQARLEYCVSLDSKAKDEACEAGVIQWMQREMDAHPTPSIWNWFR